MKSKIFDFLMPSPKWTFHIKGRSDIIFVHIPKTAGTSIRFAFDFNKPNKKKGIRKHYTCKEVISLIGREKWDQSFKFTFIRDPWERLYSFYLFQLRKETVREKSFKLFVLEDIVPLLEKTNLTERPNIFPQTFWLADENEELNFDFIGRFENLDSDFDKLSKKISINTTLDHKNKSGNSKTYKGFYDKEMIELVNNYYRQDIEAFGYSF